MAQVTRLRRPPVDMPDVDSRGSGLHRWLTGSLEGATALAGPSTCFVAFIWLAGAFVTESSAPLLLVLAVLALATSVIIAAVSRRWGTREPGWLAALLFGPSRATRGLPGLLPLVAFAFGGWLAFPGTATALEERAAVASVLAGVAAMYVGPWIARRAGWQT